MDIVITRNVSRWLPYINVSIKEPDNPYQASMYADKIEFENDMIYGFMSDRLSFALTMYGNELFIKYTC